MEEGRLVASPNLNSVTKFLHIPNGNDIENSFFYVICYALRYDKTKKLEKYVDDQLASDLDFSSLHSVRKELVLDLHYQKFEKQFYLANKTLMK